MSEELKGVPCCAPWLIFVALELLGAFRRWTS